MECVSFVLVLFEKMSQMSRWIWMGKEKSAMAVRLHSQ